MLGKDLPSVITYV